MYPEWLISLFADNTCVRCRTALTTDDIDAVGTRRPMPHDDPRAPLALIIVTCKHCGQCINCTLPLDLPAVLDAVTAFAARIARAAETKDADLNGPHFQRSPATGNATERPNIERVRPSRRDGQPLTPPTQREIQAFLNRMRATPFKRGTKGFDRWMKRMGIDPDRDPGVQ